MMRHLHMRSILKTLHEAYSAVEAITDEAFASAILNNAHMYESIIINSHKNMITKDI